LYDYHADRYFTPGSNTKIFTFYTALRIIGDSVPALKYVQRNDSLIFWGMGDPSFLYKFTFNNFRTFDFLRNSKRPVYFSHSNFYAPHFGQGWAWDDYNEEFSPERSPFPVYGNIFTVTRTSSLLKVYPHYFDQFISVGDREKKEAVIRDLHSNNFQFHPGLSQPRNKEWDIPMKIDQQLIANLLSDTLRRKVIPVRKRLPPAAQPFYSIPADSLYSELMQNSDNFIAEELLLMCAGIVRDSLNTETAIRYSLANYLNDLPDKPVWVDGSGLSRYNLFTARTIVKVWEKIFELVPRERLFPLLATGGVSGTIKKWYKAEQPYIFGKTGTLSNNHALSGFIVTKSGKVLIFAFMNNNYVVPTNDIRTNMQDILLRIYERY
jgi:serine-type D-Ala-D-Ala carboxypeptidase/endopeptidase (penicillin-binding protein 4)